MADTTIESFTFEIAVWLAGGSIAPINWNLSIVVDNLDQFGLIVFQPAKWVTGPSMLMDLTRVPDLKNYDLSSFKHISVGGSAVLPSQKKLICELLFNGRNIVQDRFQQGLLPGKWLTGPSVLLDLSNLAGLESYDLSSLTHISVGGAPVIVSQKKIICDTLFGGRNIIQDRYGCTEVGAFSLQLKNPLPDYNEKKSASVGPAAPGVTIKMAPVDIEKIAIQHPDVLEACVAGKPHPVDGEHPAAFIVKKGNSDLTEGDLVNFIN
ncbi:unnamed protein product, partial [Nesidiocoris tenuis]